MQGTQIDTSTVKNLDVNRYMGKWYEIARYDHWFERGLVGATAEYSLRPNGKIRVINSGYRNSLSGKKKSAKGKAKIPDPLEPGKLRVSFFPFIYGDYYILELDAEEYGWVLIGSSSEKYLWILSRTKRLDQGILTKILTKARARGYDTKKLIFVEQPD